MESLILANEAAVAEIRKHAKADDKDLKGWSPKTGHSGASDNASKPSITSTGIVREANKTLARRSTRPAELFR
jgi:hypothetical protein